jgi:transposase
MAADADGIPMHFILTGGNVSDFTMAQELINNVTAKFIIADKGYDSQFIVDTIEGAGAKSCIPPKSNRIRKRRYSRRIYKKRNVVERAFCRLKHCRRIATRYDRKALYFMAFLHLAAAHIWG